MKTILHVNQHNIRANSKGAYPKDLPVLTVKDYKQNRKCNEAVIKDKEAGNSILRTKLALGGGEARFTSSSFVNKIINLAAVPHASVILYNEIYAQNIYQHMMEESFISATIMQYLHED